MTRLLRAADLFCGAGGSTTGAIASGRVQVVWRDKYQEKRDG